MEAPAEELVAAPAEEPLGNSVGEVVAEPAEERVAKRLNEPAEEPAEEPAKEPAEKPEEPSVADLEEEERVRRLVKEIPDRSISGKERLPLIRVAGEERLERAVPGLIEALSDPDPEISAAASAALVGIGDPRAIEPLLEMVRKADEQILSEGPEEAPGASGAGGENYEQYLPTWVGNPHRKPFDDREAIVPQADLLPEDYLQADGAPLPAKELVLRGLKAEDHQLRKMAAKLAVGLGDLDLLAPLVESLENLQELESVRYLAAEALGGIHDERAIEPLLKALKDESVAVRYSAAAALSGRSDFRAIGALIEALQDPNEFVRSSVAYALGQIGERSSVEPLLRALDDEYDVVRFSVAKALGTIGGDAVLNGLNTRLENAGGRFRAAIIDTLGHLKDERATELLRKALLDEDVEISYRASLALMNGEGIEALDEIIEASRRFDRELMDLLNPQEPNRRGTEPLKPPDTLLGRS